MTPSSISARPVNRVGQYTVRSRTFGMRCLPVATVERQDLSRIPEVKCRMIDLYANAEVWVTTKDKSFVVGSVGSSVVVAHEKLKSAMTAT